MDVTDNCECLYVCAFVHGWSNLNDDELNAGPAQLAQKLEEEGRTGTNACEKQKTRAVARTRKLASAIEKL